MERNQFAVLSLNNLFSHLAQSRVSNSNTQHANNFKSFGLTLLLIKHTYWKKENPPPESTKYTFLYEICNNQILVLYNKPKPNKHITKMPQKSKEYYTTLSSVTSGDRKLLKMSSPDWHTKIPAEHSERSAVLVLYNSFGPETIAVIVYCLAGQM